MVLLHFTAVELVPLYHRYRLYDSHQATCIEQETTGTTEHAGTPVVSALKYLRVLYIMKLESTLSEVCNSSSAEP